MCYRFFSVAGSILASDLVYYVRSSGGGLHPLLGNRKYIYPRVGRRGRKVAGSWRAYVSGWRVQVEIGGACGYRSEVSIRGVSFSRRSALRIQINTRHLGLGGAGIRRIRRKRGDGERFERGRGGVRGKIEEEKVEETLEQQATAAPSFLQSWNTSKTSARKQFL